MRRPFITLCVIFMVGCQAPTYKKPPVNDPSTDATIQLAEAATAISHSMHDMAATEKVIFPHNRNNRVTIPNAPALQRRVSIDWSGPIEEPVKRLAKAARYRYTTIGVPPALPILISLTEKDQLIVDILRDIDYQAANHASLRVHPRQRLIELRYEKLY